MEFDQKSQTYSAPLISITALFDAFWIPKFSGFWSLFICYYSERRNDIEIVLEKYAIYSKKWCFSWSNSHCWRAIKSHLQPFSLLVQKPCWLAYTWYIFLGIATNYFIPRLVEKHCELISRNYPHALLLLISFSFFNRRLGMHGNGKARPFSLL